MIVSMRHRKGIIKYHARADSTISVFSAFSIFDVAYGICRKFRKERKV